MEEKLAEKDHSSIRDEIMKWQYRGIVFSQIALTLVIAYTGYLVSRDKKEDAALSWQAVSILPLLILTITIHITKLFELFRVRASAFLAVFYKTNWENSIGDNEVSLSNGTWTFGYNKSMAIVYLIIALGTIFILKENYGTPFYSNEAIVYSIFALLFHIVSTKLYMFKSTARKNKFIEGWKQIKSKQKNNVFTSDTVAKSDLPKFGLAVKNLK